MITSPISAPQCCAWGSGLPSGWSAGAPMFRKTKLGPERQLSIFPGVSAPAPASTQACFRCPLALGRRQRTPTYASPLSPHAWSRLHPAWGGQAMHATGPPRSGPGGQPSSEALGVPGLPPPPPGHRRTPPSPPSGSRSDSWRMSWCVGQGLYHTTTWSLADPGGGGTGLFSD